MVLMSGMVWCDAAMAAHIWLNLAIVKSAMAFIAGGEVVCGKCRFNVDLTCRAEKLALIVTFGIVLHIFH